MVMGNADKSSMYRQGLFCRQGVQTTAPMALIMSHPLPALHLHLVLDLRAGHVQ